MWWYQKFSELHLYLNFQKHDCGLSESVFLGSNITAQTPGENVNYFAQYFQSVYPSSDDFST